MKMRNVKMILEYDGTNYCGWQTQTNGVTVQAVMEKCIGKIIGRKVHVTASGRTDSGVHALGQVVNVKTFFPMDDLSFSRALNSMLPKDIAVKKIETVPEDFSSLKNARWKKYRYVIYENSVPSPLLARTSWYMPVALDIRRMRSAGAVLVGEHDFASFMGARSSAKTTIRNITALSLRKKGENLILEITGSGFLKYMVRNIVGTLVEAGKGRFTAKDVKEILTAKNRKTAGPTAPPHGLFLVEVGY